jgi:aspartate 1-decarboxylase
VLRSFLRAKLHGIVLTGTRLHYDGSITLDPALLDAAALAPFERVHVLNLANGARLETYVIRGRRGSGIVELNGPAARLGQPGDGLIVLAYAAVADGESPPRPVIVRARPGNRPPRR